MACRWFHLFCIALLTLSWLNTLECLPYPKTYDEDDERGGDEEQRESGEGEGFFSLNNFKTIVDTEAGKVKTLSLRKLHNFEASRMQIAFINMEPLSVFAPHYLDAGLLVYLHKGTALLGSIGRGNSTSEQKLKPGDIYYVPGGSVMYIMNTDDGQRLTMFCAVDTSSSLIPGLSEYFFLLGGSSISPLLGAFDRTVLKTAYNASEEELDILLRGTKVGPISFLPQREPRSYMFSNMMKNLKYERENVGNWYDIFKNYADFSNDKKEKGDDSYNTFKKDPDFKNDYGWSRTVHRHDYKMLEKPDISFFSVNLSAGAMLAPHYNPRATEFTMVLNGNGRVIMAFPNGSSAMDYQVSAGDVFWVPKYFPVCHIASMDGPMEILGFTTSSHPSNPQFFAGTNSLFKTLGSKLMATFINVDEKQLKNILNLQREAVILPSPFASSKHKGGGERKHEGGRGDHKGDEGKHSGGEEKRSIL